jgi:putative endonuclease
MTYYLYILRCADNTYYVGRTNNLTKRLRAHNFLKSGARYTRMRRPVSIIYTEEHLTLTAVLKREWQVKQFTREQKEKLWLKKISQ